MTDENEEKPKLSKTEEKESFIKQLDERIGKLKEAEESLRALTERNEELAARNLLGGKSDAGVQSLEKKEESGLEYMQKYIKENLKG